MKYFLPFGSNEDHFCDIDYLLLTKKYKDYISGIYFVPERQGIIDAYSIGAIKDTDQIQKMLYRFNKLGLMNFALFNDYPINDDPNKTSINKCLNTLKEYQGLVQGITTANFYIAQAVSEKFPEIKIDISSNRFAYNPRTIDYWKRHCNLYSINVPRDTLRIPGRIDDYVGLGVKIKALVNECCLFGCPLSQSCRIDGMVYCCRNFSLKNFLQSNWMPPSMIAKVKDKIDIAKIGHRSLPTRKIFNILESYISEDDNYNAVDIVSGSQMQMFPAEYKIPINKVPKKIFSCECKECSTCKICDGFVKYLQKINAQFDIKG